jgi:hypothetical protein
MRSDVHTAALRAAAKVAFSVAFLGGCSAAPDLAEGDELTDNQDGVEPGTSESDLNAKKPRQPKKPKVVAPAPATTCTGTGPSTPPSCETLVNAAFPTEGDYPGTKQSVSPAVQTCCAELLVKSQGMLATHRWDCCANLPANPPEGTGIACTPWGPPVPPAMKRRVKPVLPPDAWLAQDVVA